MVFMSDFLSSRLTSYYDCNNDYMAIPRLNSASLLHAFPFDLGP